MEERLEKPHLISLYCNIDNGATCFLQTSKSMLPIENIINTAILYTESHKNVYADYF